MNAAEFNALYEVGVPVFAYPGCRPEDKPNDRRLVTRTRSKASVLGGHTDVVWVDDHSACIALSHIDVVSEDEWKAAKAADELAAYQSLELGAPDGRVSASCGNPEHPTWLRTPNDARGCPWCRIAEVRAEALAEAKDAVVEWLVKKAHEGTEVTRLADKVERGAIRLFLDAELAAAAPTPQHYDKVPDPQDGCHWCACGNRWPCKDAPAMTAKPDAADVVAYRNPHNAQSLLCRVHGPRYVGMVPVTAEDLPDGGTCTFGILSDLECGRDVLIDPKREAAS